MKTIISIGLLLVGIASGSAIAQESGQSLGEAARKARKEKSSTDHVAAKKVATEDDDDPDAGGVWRVRICKYSPCYELSVVLPKEPKWRRKAEQPRPVLIPVNGHEDDSSRDIRVYAAESIEPMYLLDKAGRTFVQGWFARPEYFGQSARILKDDHVRIPDNANANISHFIITTPNLKYRGLSIVASHPGGNYGFACVFREEDAEVAGSVCDAVITSARSQELAPAKLPEYPPDTYGVEREDPER